MNLSKHVLQFSVSVLFALSLGFSSAPAFAQQAGQRTFASAEEAASALFAAMQSQDEQVPLSVLGPAGKDVISSGDPVEDSDTRVGFVVKYKEMHRFVTEPNGALTLVIGAENWPFPIPLVKNNRSWYFDTVAASAKMNLPPWMRPVNWSKRKNNISRVPHIGAVPMMHSTAPSTRKSHMRAKISHPTKLASTYRLMVIFSGSSRARGLMRRAEPGTISPTERMTGGFAFVAYPAEYRSSGVMTLIIDQSGTIYEKDLGPDTTKLAQAMTAFDPDSTWHKTE